MYRYEDVIFRKREWVADLCAWYGWSVPEEVRNAVADRHDVVPERPDPDVHVRQVRPGNHREELPPEAIEHLDRVFDPYLRLFGYR